jgi:metal transporter CNNM
VFGQDERKIMQAALDLEKKTATDIMTKIEDVYMLDINTKLDQTTLREVYTKGFSRIPIYEGNKNNIIGILMARDLILINPEKYVITLK